MRHQNRNRVFGANAEAAKQVGRLADFSYQRRIADPLVAAGVIDIRQIVQRAAIGRSSRCVLNQSEGCRRRQKGVQPALFDSAEIC
jgi:hypothetical protein